MIHQLPVSLVNRIAAGEVIERPAAVVKELVENAIDAGARRIDVDVRDGGRELIRVTDDGGGIGPDDLPLAFAPHATSKLQCDEDLFRILTMGFRGEALASIGAVSQARILSRRNQDVAAHEIINNGGELSGPRAASGNVGTSVEVRNLFFNTPARRKFLKGGATEMGHISDMLLRLALPNPAISFSLSHNGRQSMRLEAGDAIQRLLAAWPLELREQRLPLELADGPLTIQGVIGLPEAAGPTPKHQFLFLNQRFIRDRFLQHALKEAYRGLTEPGRYPAAVLLVTMPPQDVDVNVHPTKVEVRFRDSGRLHGLVLAGVREKLLGSNLAPRAVARLSQPPLGDAPGSSSASEDPSAAGLGPDADAETQNIRQKLADFFSSSAPAAEAAWSLRSPAPPPAPLWPHPSPPANHPPVHDAASASDTADATAAAAPAPLPAAAPVASAALASYAARPANASPPAMQLHNSYLVVEADDGLEIIDQHALHERILFEQLQARLAAGPLESQRLLLAATVRATPRQMAMLESLQPLFGKLGIEADAFGPDALAIQAFPTFLHKLDPAQFVSELLEKGEQEQLDLHPEELLHEVLDMMACKAAVKAGDPLSAQEIESLLARRHSVDRSSNCPHGRPTTLRLTLKDLEKQFKRSGF